MVRVLSISAILVAALPWATQVVSFVIPTTANGGGRQQDVELYSNADDLKDETPAEKEERMKLVRQIQASFYQNEGDHHLVTKGDCFENVPLFRVQWTELPGYQNMLNIHVPHYTHMFRRILKGPKPWRFGHVYLPEGSENLNNPLYNFDNGDNSEATTIGTLMQISDVIEDDKGQFGIIVQAVDRFRVVKATQHVPYAVATVKLLADEEFDYPVSTTDSSSCPVMKDFEAWNEWEVRPTSWQDRDGRGNINISPLVNYNYEVFPDELSTSASSNTATASDPFLLELEYRVWVELDAMLTLLGQVSSFKIPVPSQLLGLLPTELPTTRWPADFQLESVAAQLQQSNAEVGTFTKSPFVRVAQCPTYPSVRRASRLSYVIWILIDSILHLTGKDAPTRQDLLEMTSVAERLRATYQQLNATNTNLRKALPPPRR
jgi:Lon protease-like protein